MVESAPPESSAGNTGSDVRIGPALLNGGRPASGGASTASPCQTHHHSARRRGAQSGRQPLPTGDSRGCLQRRPRAAEAGSAGPARPQAVHAPVSRRRAGGLGSILEERDEPEEDAHEEEVVDGAIEGSPEGDSASASTSPQAHEVASSRSSSSNSSSPSGGSSGTFSSSPGSTRNTPSHRGVRPQPVSMHVPASVSANPCHLGPEALPAKIGSFKGRAPVADSDGSLDGSLELSSSSSSQDMSSFFPSLALGTVAVGLCGIGWLAYDHTTVLQVLEWAHRLRRSWKSQAAFTALLTASTVCMLPSSPIEMAGGAIFGFNPGLLLCIVGKQVGNAIAFQLARSLSRDLVKKHVTPQSRLMQQAEKMANVAPWKTCFCVRAAPVPLVIKNYGLAVLGVPFTHAMAASLVCGPLYSVKNVWMGSTAISIAEVLNGQISGAAAQLAAGTAVAGTLGALLAFGALATLHSQALQGFMFEEGELKEDLESPAG
mmetsp:Transcript_13226/g.30945  ORF Transcript_13226/g.30945 Transcript_13226/m.30945 type:complete len:488 (+) Transcript_13226:80-1543(+)